MKIIRFQYGQKEPQFGLLEGNQVKELEGRIGEQLVATGRVFPLAAVTLLAPCQPGKVVCVGLNYRDHAEELGLELPAEPVLFLKPPTSIIGPQQDIVLPVMSERVDYEAELAVVIKERVRKISPEEAASCILGYTCANDVTARDLQQRDGQWTRAKSFDTFCPIGPWIETDVDPTGLEISLYLNGERRQYSNTNQLIFGVYELVSFISQIMTLEPGDLILTGTPAGIGSLQAGDRVEVAIPAIGSLVNNVVTE